MWKRSGNSHKDIKEKKVGNMTVRELKKLIKDTVLEVIDPDYGLELRPEVEKELRESLKQKENGIPLETVTKEYEGINNII
ncbi:MAG: hypothetical protein A3G70_09280 [Planctomycetes bacterium RIFCSPLOWO2_12_FULL_39_13]|nr:MAG: hypothetical protein A3G70_09280 [Planctomycetes bacterium RIFCSPLOWO2_12_FULL_39_13]